MRISSDGFQMFNSNMKHKSRQGASFKMMFLGLQVATFLFLVKVRLFPESLIVVFNDHKCVKFL